MRIALTPGDPDGIGPEIVLKAFRGKSFRQAGVEIICIGAREPFDHLGADLVPVSLAQLHSRKLPKKRQNQIYFLLAPTRAPKRGAKTLFLPGYQSGWSIETATRLVLRGSCDAIVTGPISKERLQRGGYLYPGHTEFLAELCGVKHVTMMLANDTLRISLVTTHLALKDVPRALTRKLLRQVIEDTVSHLHAWWGIRKPKIAVAALNPHAGEAGIFGKEEIRVIEPEVRALNRRTRRSFVLEGPLSADTLFAKHVIAKPRDRYDAVVCMYHDQGLIPVKLLDFKQTVNVTLGLPIVRTSVDHGVGFDIAGKGKADPSSLEAALRLAIRIVRNKKRAS